MGGLAALQAALPGIADAYEIACRGMKGYDLTKCLREKRKQEETDEDGDIESINDAKARLRQYEQPGELVTLPSGIQYRELLTGTGPEAFIGSRCDILYTVYKLSSGAYYKYSSGGTPVLLFAKGYGTEGKNDVGETYTFTLGDKTALPLAATLGMVGMRAGGQRRILVPPELGWAYDPQVGPPPDTFGARRRLANNKDAPLLFEAEIMRVRNGSEADVVDTSQLDSIQRTPYSLPAPPTYQKSDRLT